LILIPYFTASRTQTDEVSRRGPLNLPSDNNRFDPVIDLPVFTVGTGICFLEEW